MEIITVIMVITMLKRMLRIRSKRQRKRNKRRRARRRAKVRARRKARKRRQQRILPKVIKERMVKMELTKKVITTMKSMVMRKQDMGMRNTKPRMRTQTKRNPIGSKMSL